jgi:hypothetical protein
MTTEPGDAMSYTHDIFISYYSKCTTTRWMRNVFIPQLTAWLAPKRIHGVKFWYDDERIEAGNNWPEALRTGLSTSKLLLPMLTASYFGSDWCRRELAVMLERQQKLNLCSPTNIRGLIVPIQVFDGDKYPTLLTDHVQLRDFTAFTYITPQTRTKKWTFFIEALRRLADEIDVLLNAAPDHCHTWRDLFTGDEIEQRLRVEEPPPQPPRL